MPWILTRHEGRGVSMNALTDGAGASHDRLNRSLRKRILPGELAPGATIALRGMGAISGF